MMILMMKYSVFNLVLACGIAICLIATIFCSLSVLRVLIRPRPGKVGGDRAQSKRRAFKTIIIILGVLLFKFVGNLTCHLINVKKVLCVVMATQVWFNVPCSLVLPLLFLQELGRFQDVNTTHVFLLDDWFMCWTWGWGWEGKDTVLPVCMSVPFILKKC